MTFYIPPDKPWRHPVIAFLIISLGIVILLFILTACGSPTGEAHYAAQTEAANRIRDLPTQTPWVVTATPDTTDQPTATDTAEVVQCAPRYLEQITVGYIPGLDIGDKKSPALVVMGCVTFTADFGDAYLTGQVAEDGLSLESCTLFADHSYPCQLAIRNLGEMNVWATYSNKNGQEFPICLAVSNKEYNVECE